MRVFAAKTRPRALAASLSASTQQRTRSHPASLTTYLERISETWSTLIAPNLLAALLFFSRPRHALLLNLCQENRFPVQTLV